jgi:hypothetical protein
MALATNGTWSPPPLDSLNFFTDCALTNNFLASWFDITSTTNLSARTGSNKSAAFWIPDTLETKTTEAYFRAALAEGERDVPTYGEIMQWEFTLRQNASDSLTGLLDEAKDLEDTALPERKPMYFSVVVDLPAKACRGKEPVCNLSFDPYRLSPINGPGVRIYAANVGSPSEVDTNGEVDVHLLLCSMRDCYILRADRPSRLFFHRRPG